jgi:hypothetical protein
VIASPLTPDQLAKFEFVINGSETELAIMSCSIYGDPVATICRLRPAGDKYVLEPLFIELSPTLAASLLSSDGEPLVNLTGSA